MIKEKISLLDKETNVVRVFRSDKAEHLMIILPAMGVKAQYYEPFAHKLNTAGYHVITMDWRGNGDSSVRASRKSDFGYSTLIQDLKTLLEYGKKKFPRSQVTIIGHSLGGQIASLYASAYPNHVCSLILVASCSVYYKGWDKKDQIKVLVAGNVFPFIARLVGYFPGKKIGFSGREARKVIKDWASNALTGQYRLSDSTFNYEEALQKLEMKILAFSVQDDTFASEQAIDNLLNKFHGKSEITKVHLTSEKTKIDTLNHFNWAKNPDYLVSKIGDWEKA